MPTPRSPFGVVAGAPGRSFGTISHGFRIGGAAGSSRRFRSVGGDRSSMAFGDDTAGVSPSGGTSGDGCSGRFDRDVRVEAPLAGLSHERHAAHPAEVQRFASARPSGRVVGHERPHVLWHGVMKPPLGVTSERTVRAGLAVHPPGCPAGWASNVSRGEGRLVAHRCRCRQPRGLSFPG